MKSIQYMKRALKLAKKGICSVSPNPMVGCVIVYDNNIIGEGWHKAYGDAHAEVNAIQSVSDNKLLQHSTAYITLEPCSHHGKTPPCADLLIKKKIKKVVIATLDPNPLVSGKGVKKLQEAGIETTVGVLEEEAKWLNRRFFTRMKSKRPYIILKWAETANGYIAKNNYDSKWISNSFSRQIVHKWRSEEDAILVGANTVYYDDPKLTVRSWTGKNPVRIILDPERKTPSSAAVFNHKVKTICYTHKKSEKSKNLIFVEASKNRFLEEVLEDLYSKNIASLIIEGGAYTLKEFIKKGLWDEARIFKTEKLFKSGIYTPKFEQATLIHQERILNDMLFYFIRSAP